MKRSPMWRPSGLAAALAVIAAAAPATARAGGGHRIRVALAPLSSVGDTTSADLRADTLLLSRGLASVPGVEVVHHRALARALRASKRPELLVCEGAPACLAQVGRLVGASEVVYGELGGLGGARVIYLKLIAVGSARQLRSTVLELGGTGDARGQARAAAHRLLAPQTYVGTLAITVDVPGAAIFIDGRQVATSPAKPIQVSVGTHALRVTNPAYRDFVRFVKVPFEGTIPIKVSLQQYAIVGSNLRRKLGARAGYGTGATPWYRRWYAVAGFGAAVLVTSAIVAGIASGGISADHVKTINPPK